MVESANWQSLPLYVGSILAPATNERTPLVGVFSLVNG